MRVRGSPWLTSVLLVTASALGSFLLWEAATDTWILYLTQKSVASGKQNETVLERLVWARENLPVDVRVLRTIARLHVAEASGTDRDANLSSALEALKSASRAAPLDASLHYSLGWLYFTKPDERAAELSFVRALSLDALNAEHMYGLGRLRESQQRIEEAKALYSAALSLRQLPKAEVRLENLERGDLSQ